MTILLHRHSAERLRAIAAVKRYRVSLHDAPGAEGYVNAEVHEMLSASEAFLLGFELAVALRGEQAAVKER